MELSTYHIPSSPAAHAPLVPPLLALTPGVVHLLRLAVPPHPLRGLALRRRVAITIEEALLQRAADHLLLGDALAKLLVQRRGGEGRQRAVHVRLLLAPLALEGVGREQLGLRRRAQVDEARLQLVQARGQLEVLVERGVERRLGVGGRRVGCGRRGCEGREQLRAGEEVGEIEFTRGAGR